MACDEMRYGPATYEPGESPGSFPHAQGVGASSTVGLPFAPVATPILAESPSGLGPSLGEGGMSPIAPPGAPAAPVSSSLPLTPWAGPIPPVPGPYPWPAPYPPWPESYPPWPYPRPLTPALPGCTEPRQGCYRISFLPGRQVPSGKYLLEPWAFFGTMRVDHAGYPAGVGLVISGDLYRFTRDPFWPDVEAVPSTPWDIPIYERGRYYSYLKVTNLQWGNSCQLILTAEEYVYTPPPAGKSGSTFPEPPGTLTVTIVLDRQSAPPGYTSDYFAGKLYAGFVEQGTFTMGWVSEYFRKATLEIDTLVGAVAPTAVPARSGSGMEDFRTAFASVGWDLNVVYDQENVPVPPYMPNPAACFSFENKNLGELSALLLDVRNPATNLDVEWRVQLVVVPGTINCPDTGSRGFALAEGAVSFSDGGFPSSQSYHYGTAANRTQRQEPRAYLRSACHEVGHKFRQHHTDAYGLPNDNSIMTTTENVANVLNGSAFGAPGVFPDDISLAFSRHTRQFLAHWPDNLVRPGGSSVVPGSSIPLAYVVPRSSLLADDLSIPEADYLPPETLELTLQPESSRIELGEPLRLGWRLVNNSDAPIRTPSDIRIEAEQAFITVTNPNGLSKPMPSVVQIDAGHTEDLHPGQSLSAETRVFWSSTGFAFETPGRHFVELRLVWTDAGVPLGVRATMKVWVKYPQSPVDDEAADLLLDPEVGMYVALGGGASHLRGAVSRLERAMAIQPPPGALRGYHDLLPDSQSDGSGDEHDGVS
jgi:hypothetical protein